IKIINPAGPIDFAVISRSSSLVNPSLIPKTYHAIKFAIIKAEKGCPIKFRIIFRFSLFMGISPLFTKVLIKIRRIGIAIIPKIVYILGIFLLVSLGLLSVFKSNFGASTYILLPIYFP